MLGDQQKTYYYYQRQMRRKNIQILRKSPEASLPNLRDTNQKLKSVQQLMEQIRCSNSIANVRVLRPKLLFVNGLVKEIAQPEILKSNEFLGQYGNIEKLTITKGKESFYSAFVEYSNEVQAGLVLLSLDQFEYKGRVIRVFYGSTKYCYSFLSGEQCQIKRCSFSHSFEKSFTYFKENSQSINHYRIAEKIVKGMLGQLLAKRWPRRVLPNPQTVLSRLLQLPATDSESSSSQQYSQRMTAADWEQLQREIDSYVMNYEEKPLSKKKTAVQEFLEHAEEKLLSLIFRSSIIDQ